jgi:hypothetical protein
MRFQRAWLLSSDCVAAASRLAVGWSLGAPSRSAVARHFVRPAPRGPRSPRRRRGRHVSM